MSFDVTLYCIVNTADDHRFSHPVLTHHQVATPGKPDIWSTKDFSWRKQACLRFAIVVCKNYSSNVAAVSGLQKYCGYRHARDGSVTSMFTPSAYQYNPRHSTGPSEIQRTARDLTADNAVAAPQADDLVKLGKRDAWAKFLAYEVSHRLLCHLELKPKLDPHTFLQHRAACSNRNLQYILHILILVCFLAKGTLLKQVMHRLC